MADNPLRRPYVGGVGNVFPGEAPPGYERDRNGLLVPGIDHSAPINYTLSADGKVTPIDGGGGGGGDGGGGLPPDGGGGNLPPLPPNLADYFVVHGDLLVTNNPDDGQTQWTIDYTPPSGTWYLCVVVFTWGREFLNVNTPARVAPTLTFNGSNGTGGWGTWGWSGTSVVDSNSTVQNWNAPSSGTILLDISAIKGGYNNYIAMLPISVIGHSLIPPSSTSVPNSGTAGSSLVVSDSRTVTQPRVWCWANANMVDFAAAPVGISTWSGFNVFELGFTAPTPTTGSDNRYKFGWINLGYQAPGTEVIFVGFSSTSSRRGVGVYRNWII